MSRLMWWMAIAVPGAAVAVNSKCPPDPVGPADTVESRIDPNGCRSRDLIPGSTSEFPTREFAVEIRVRGILTIEASSTEFDTVLAVTAPRFAQLASNDDIAQGRTDSRAVMSVTPDTYSVFVASKRGGGAFTLKLSFQEQSDCQPRDLPTGTFNGNLNAQSCRYYDAVAPTGFLPPADLFRFRADTPKVITALMQSRAFDSFLMVADAKTGQRIAFDDDGADGVADSLLISSLPPGDYYLATTVAGGAGGAYALQVLIEDPVACDTRDLNFGDTVPGQLAATDCRLLDIEVPDDTENRLDLYRLRIAEPGVLAAEITSNQLSTALLLFDKDRKFIDLSATPVPGRNQTVRLEISVQPGEYLLGATHTVLQVGNYTLRATLDPLRPCPADSLPPDGSASGSLRSTDCRFLDALPLSRVTVNAKPFKIALAQPGQLRIDMTSTDVDAFLVLLDAGNKVLAQDNDSGGNRDARIHSRLAAGTYTVLATTAAAQAGSFALRLGFADPPACPAADIAFGQVATGQLSVDDCRVRDLILDDARPFQGKLHRFDLAEPGTVAIDATSFFFAPALILVDSNGRRIVEDSLAQDAVVGGARIRRSLAAGRYAVVVTATAGLAGDYHLLAQRGAP
jgi:hypothetical protein